MDIYRKNACFLNGIRVIYFFNTKNYARRHLSDYILFCINSPIFKLTNCFDKCFISAHKYLFRKYLLKTFQFGTRICCNFLQETLSQSLYSTASTLTSMYVTVYIILIQIFRDSIDIIL